ncbi:hypothetical protein DL93DRAFT_2165748 [Clavulina sp. PMI_390]|nr:hypothetical protein DL93DRAFT_2165748 [Clavulina sp. PMI_390]
MSSQRTSDCCGTLPPIVPKDYQRVGSVKQTAAGLKYYESTVDVKRTDLGIIVAYDVTGSESPQTAQQIDRISKGLGCKVVMPYLFGEDGGYTKPRNTPEELDVMWAWIAERAPPAKVVERIRDIIGVLNAEGITQVAALGFCWGAIQVTELCTIPNLLVAGASLHGRAYDAAQGSRIVVPFYNMPSMDEGAQPEFMSAIPVLVRDKCKEKHWDDMRHGFSSSLGNWEGDGLVKRRAEEAMQVFVDWIQEVVVAT